LRQELKFIVGIPWKAACSLKAWKLLALRRAAFNRTSVSPSR
jgi:hypothetical protein